MSDYPELPFTAVVVDGPPDSPRTRPMYGDGSVGPEDPTLFERVHAGEFGPFIQVGLSSSYMLVPWWGTPKTTPYGPTSYPSGDVLADYDREKKRMSDAALAEQRRMSHGHWGFYDDDYVRGIVFNEGVEYGLTSYTDTANFDEPTRALAEAAAAAIRARDEWEELLGEDGRDEEGLWELAGQAEAAKQAFCRHLGVGNQPWSGPEQYD